jgi:hypothetical protein
MHETHAHRLAKDWIQAVRAEDVWPWDADQNQGVADSATAAVIEALQLLIPDPDLATIGRTSDSVPELWVLADQGLYVIGCDSINNRYQARIKSRRLHLEPKAASVSVTSLLETMHEHTRGDLAWSFTVGVETFELTTHPSPDERERERHRFALALAAKLGWKPAMDGPAE